MVPKTNIKFPIKSIIIANVAEYYQPIFKQCQENEKNNSWITPSHAECDMALFWAKDNKLIILPKQIDEYFFEDTKAVFNYNNVVFAYPNNCGESLCTAIENDPDLFDFLVEVIKKSDKPEIICWGTTKPFIDLLKRIEEKGGIFTAPETPCRDDYWTVPYLDSKIGFREFFRNVHVNLPGGNIAPGMICSNIEMAIEVLKSDKFFIGNGVVIKSNEGVGGYGTLLFDQAHTKDYRNFSRKLLAISKVMPIFSYSPLIIEEYISSPANSTISSPSVQGIVYASGVVEIIAITGQLVNRTGRYEGSVLSPGIFSDELQLNIYNLGYSLGIEVSKLGYRGVFNFDTVLDNNGQIYFVEMNARRTSVKYILDMASYLFGEKWQNKISIISNERFEATKLKNLSYREIHSLLSEFLFPIGGKPQGVIITITSTLKTNTPRIGFVVVGPDLSVSEKIYSKICEILGNKSLLLSTLPTSLDNS